MSLRVSPGAKRTRIVGEYGDRLKIQVNAPPEGGRANARLIQALAQWLAVPEAKISIVAGANARDKVIAIEGLGPEEARGRLVRAQEGQGRGRGG